MCVTLNHLPLLNSSSFLISSILQSYLIFSLCFSISRLFSSFPLSGQWCKRGRRELKTPPTTSIFVPFSLKFGCFSFPSFINCKILLSYAFSCISSPALSLRTFSVPTAFFISFLFLWFCSPMLLFVISSVQIIFFFFLFHSSGPACLCSLFPHRSNLRSSFPAF